MPDFVRFGSKPIRDIEEKPSLETEIQGHIRTFAQACGYPPNQVFIGNRHPDWLNSVPKPWYENGMNDAPRQGLFRRDHARRGVLRVGEDGCTSSTWYGLSRIF